MGQKNSCSPYRDFAKTPFFVAYLLLVAVYVAGMMWRVPLLSGLSMFLITLAALAVMYRNSRPISAYNSKKSDWICRPVLLYAASWSAATFLQFLSSHVLPGSGFLEALTYAVFSIASFFVFVAGLMLLLAIRERLDMKQFAIDVLTMTAVLWILAVSIIKSVGTVQSFGIYPLFFFFVLLDLFSFILVLSTSLSLRKSKNRACVNVLLISLFTFSVLNFILIVQAIAGQYSGYGVLDLLHTFPLFLFVWASEVIRAIVEAKGSLFWDEKAETGNLPDNHGRSYLPAGLLLFGIYLYVIGLIPSEVMVAVLILLVVYFLISLFYQETLRSTSLLRLQMDQNRVLESRVQERTAELTRKNEELERIINVDPLTKLLSRRYFVERLTELYQSNTRTPSGLIIADLLKFKNLNSMMGSLTGDALLIELADRLRDRYGSTYEVFRLGGNEFGLFLPGMGDVHAVLRITREMDSLIREPFERNSLSIRVVPAFGISMYPKNTAFLGDLLKNGEISVRRAKEIDMDFKCVIYNEMLHSYEKRRMQIQSLLETIDFDREFELYYQPQYAVEGGRLTGMEALLRWHSGTFGDVSPGEFIPIAEESNAVARIVDWTMENAFTQIRQWKDRCGSSADGLRVAVNIPPKYIGAVDFASRVKSRMHKGDVRPEWVNMEITERGVLDLELPVIRAFDELSSLGVTISIDDFGTGYSPLPSLRRMRASTLKIAKELVDAMTAGSDGEAIVKAVVMMAEGLGIHVLAEGVETEEQLDKLRAFGCHGVQGYHFGRPVPAAEFEATYLKSPM